MYGYVQLNLITHRHTDTHTHTPKRAQPPPPRRMLPPHPSSLPWRATHTHTHTHTLYLLSSPPETISPFLWLQSMVKMTPSCAFHWQPQRATAMDGLTVNMDGTVLYTVTHSTSWYCVGTYVPTVTGTRTHTRAHAHTHKHTYHTCLGLTDG